ncbi:NlpC/P60 family protein [Nocardia jiangxiensis]|uniref:NlpC/P60 family protein n=1 Tax=Nocardia jiangxiensis TaxID=282685 RepID=A0ABW6S757_9NOCA|nr:NlpC/P60 family protein [Nocardia jiangxiensis]
MAGTTRGGSFRIALGLLVCVATVIVVTPVAGAVPPPPPNPSDNDIAAAGAQVTNGVNQVGALINDVAAVGQQIQQLDSVVAQKREAVNKALVDLQSAREQADAAASAVAGTQRALVASGTAVDQARISFDKFAEQAYMNPGSDSMVNYLSGGSPARSLERAQLLSVASTSQDAALNGMRRAQIERANADSAARRAKQTADATAATAEAKKAQAQSAVSAAESAVNEQTAQRDALLKQRDVAQQRLDAARQQVAGLQGERAAYEEWDRQRRIEELAAAAAVASAAVRAASDAAARERAEQLGDGKRPHTQLDDDPPPHKSMPSAPSRPDGTPAELIEMVVDRAMSQLGVIYAWGGGNEDGPTKGIRDGGVADRYGDYKKTGFDCSGLMVYAFAGVGISLPHYSGYQYQMGAKVPVVQRERGDMLFWGRNGSEHVALYLGNGKMIEAPESGEVVRVTAVRTSGIMPNAIRLIS